MLNNSRLKKIKRKGNVVLNSRFLKNLSLPERYELMQLCHRRSYKEKEYIYHQEDPGSGMYFIEEGKVELLVESEDEEEDSYRYELEAPESFGALSLRYEVRRLSSVRCVTDCTLLGFFQPDYNTLKDRHPKIALKVIETISLIAMKQLQRTTRALIDATSLSEALSIQFRTYYGEDLGDTLT